MRTFITSVFTILFFVGRASLAIDASFCTDASRMENPHPEKGLPIKPEMKQITLVLQGAGDVLSRLHWPGIKLAEAKNPDKVIKKIIVDNSKYWISGPPAVVEKMRATIAMVTSDPNTTYVDLAQYPSEEAAQAYLNSLKPNAELILTPDFAHLNNARKADKRAGEVAVEKPFAPPEQADDLDKFTSETKDHSNSFFGFDHFRAFMTLQPEQVSEVYNHLGGKIKRVQWYLVEDHTNQDAYYDSKVKATDAITNEGRVKALGSGMIPDLSPHLFASFVKSFFKPGSFTPHWLQAAQYEGSPIKGETFAALGFTIEGAHGETIGGEAYMGKGIRGVKALGPDFDGNALAMVFIGENGHRVVFDMGPLLPEHPEYNPDSMKAVLLDSQGKRLKSLELPEAYALQYDSLINGRREGFVSYPEAVAQVAWINFMKVTEQQYLNNNNGAFPVIPLRLSNGQVPYLEDFKRKDRGLPFIVFDQKNVKKVKEKLSSVNDGK